MAARKRRTELSEDWKERIRAGVIMDRLIKHVAGDIELSATQVRAADILLRKIVPDLQRTEVEANIKHSLEDAISRLREPA